MICVKFLDDVGATVNAMGTPGDKFPISKVVHGLPTSDNEPAELIEDPSLLEQSTEMTILRDIPSLGIFMEHGLEQTTDKDILLGPTPAVNLQTLEDLEKQLLFDSTLTSTSETKTSNVPLLFDSVKQPQQQKSFNVMQELSLPGPSGLQTPKTSKQVTAVVKVAPKRNKKPPPSSQTPKKPHLCSICNKNFQSSNKLISHQLVHTGGTPFKCEHCKKSFSSKFKLVRHVLIHSDRKPFSCTVCERTFHRKDHLKNHIKVHSPSKKIYVCEKTNCRKEYTSVMSYRKHLALHSAEEGGLECKICLKTFETKADILYHLKIHAGSRTVKNPNEKKFTCDYCDRKFFTRKDVRRHLVVHTGTRNFLCQFCPQRFGRKDHLVRHIKKSHSTNYSESESTDVSQVDIALQDTSYADDKSKTVELLELPSENKNDIKLDMPQKLEIPSVENILFSRRYTELSPMLCSEPESLQYLPHTSTESEKLELLPGGGLPTDSELLTELVVMKEEYEQQLVTHTEASEDPVGLIVPQDIEDLQNQSLLPSDMIDTDILRLISEGSSQLTEDENNLPLPGFSQAFQQPPS